VPAYDRYFADEIRATGQKYSGLKKGDFTSVINYYKQNINSFLEAGKEITASSGYSLSSNETA